MQTRRLDAVLCKSWSAIKKNWDKVTASASARSVHDLRVALRRLIVLMEVLDVLTDVKGISKQGRALKKLQDRLGPLRDIDVQLRLATQGDIAMLHGFIDYLKEERAKERQLAVKRMRRARKNKLRNEMTRIRRDAIAQLGKKPARSVRLEISRLLGAQAKVLKKRQSEYDPDNAEELHAYRIAVRRLRFFLEAAQAVFPNIGETRLPALRKEQRRIGAIHDRYLLSSSFQKWNS